MQVRPSLVQFVSRGAVAVMEIRELPTSFIRSIYLGMSIPSQRFRPLPRRHRLGHKVLCFAD
jgi:hypothetical protein